jgi:RHS repeat-associated protein
MTNRFGEATTLTYNTLGHVSRRTGTTSYLPGGLKNQTRQTNSSQTTTATRTYDAFRNVTSSSGTWNGPFGFGMSRLDCPIARLVEPESAGTWNGGAFGYQEDATGLKLLGHPYYDSSLGRFITRDPIKDGRNWYAYCSNDPVNWMDQDGLFDKRVFDALSKAGREGRLDPGVAQRYREDKDFCERLRRKIEANKEEREDRVAPKTGDKKKGKGPRYEADEDKRKGQRGNRKKDRIRRNDDSTQEEIEKAANELLGGKAPSEGVPESDRANGDSTSAYAGAGLALALILGAGLIIVSGGGAAVVVAGAGLLGGATILPGLRGSAGGG